MSVTLEQAQKIIQLHAAMKSLHERLAVVAKLRESGCKVTIEFTTKKPNGYEETALKITDGSVFDHQTNDTAALVLARYSDGLAAKLRKTERELIELGGQP